MDEYINEVKEWNNRSWYRLNMEVGRTALNHIIVRRNRVYIIGTGMGADLKMLDEYKGLDVMGIEPRKTFQSRAQKEYNKRGQLLFKGSCGDFAALNKSLEGIFIFNHSINHIPLDELEELRKSIKSGHIIIFSPKPTKNKRDKTIIEYRTLIDLERIFKVKHIRYQEFGTTQLTVLKI